MVSDGWVKERLGSVATFKNGLNYARTDSGEVVKIVGVSDFKDLSELRNTARLEWVQVANSLRDDELLKSGDLLFVRSNGNKDLIGRCLYFPQINERISFSGFTIRARMDSTKIIPEYASFLVRSSLVKRQFSESGGGTNISNLNQQILGGVVFGLPPKKEQKKIVEILSTWDQAIISCERLLEENLQQKHWLMQQLLSGKRRLIGFTAQWRSVSLGELFRERSETGWDSLPLLSITSEGGVVDREQIGRKDTSNADKSKYLRICPDDIGYNTMRMWQGVSGLSALEGLVSPAYTVLIPQEGIDPLFAAYLFKSPTLVHAFYRHSQGLVSDTWNLKYSNFSKIKWSIPCVEEQKAIATVFSINDHEIKALKTKLTCLKQEKKALMQQLLTGKRRVKIDELEIA